MARDVCDLRHLTGAARNVTHNILSYLQILVRTSLTLELEALRTSAVQLAISRVSILAL